MTEYQHRMIIDMSGKVLKSIAAKYDKVMKGMKETMAGGMIETEASRIYHEGEKRKAERTAVRLHTRGTDPAEIADILEVDIQEVRKWIRKGVTTD
ncbi:MAG: hypothetical protein LUE16_04180 [Lachnospiraceae bacterium]|nr:hypothetical protein [Lachnospiraceae bacterium]